MKRFYTVTILFIITALLTISLIPLVPNVNADPTILWLECDFNSSYFDDYGPLYLTGSNPKLEFRGSDSFDTIHIQIYSNTYGGGFFASAAQLECVDGYVQEPLKNIIKTINGETGEPFIEAQHQIGYYGITRSGTHFPSSGWKYLVNIKGSSYSWDTNMMPIKVDFTKPEIHNIQVSGGIFSKVITVTATDQESGMRNLLVYVNGVERSEGQIIGQMGDAYMTRIVTLDKATSLQLQTIDVKAEDMAGHKSQEGDNVDPENLPPEDPDQPSGPISGESSFSYEWSTSSVDPDEDQIKYGFDWGDGSSTTWTSFLDSGDVASISHEYQSSGQYTIRALAKDEVDLESDWSNGLTVQITAENNPPDKPDTPTGPSSGFTGASYGFETDSEDPEGDQIDYKFDWGDEAESSWGSKTRSHSWNSAGTFTVKAKARDDYEESDWSRGKTVQIKTNNPPNTPNEPTGETECNIGIEYQYTARMVTDPDGHDVRYKFNWGDGSNSGWIDSPTAKHKWTSKGDFDITVTAKDEHGATSSKSNSLTVTIHNDAPNTPEIINAPEAGKTTDKITFTASSTDPDSHDLNYLFNWNDGTDSWTELKSSGVEVSASHSWTQEGTYQIKVKAQDEFGEESSWSDEVTISITKKSKSSGFIFPAQIIQRIIQLFPLFERFLIIW